MKKCTWCGKEYEDDSQFCPIDNEPLVSATPSDKNERNPFFEKRVGINGWIKSESSRKGRAKIIAGRTWEIKDSFAKMVLYGSYLRLETLGGPYLIKFRDITKLEKKFLAWEMSWEDSVNSGELCIGGWGFETFVEYIRKGMNKC